MPIKPEVRQLPFKFSRLVDVRLLGKSLTGPLGPHRIIGIVINRPQEI